MMGEGDSTVAVRSLEPSISFGRFENDLLSWDKWSAFSQNKYLEEVEKCATPGSVAQKKAFFEARNMLIAMRKVEMVNKQVEASHELSEENEIQNTIGTEVNRYDEEVMDEILYGSELGNSGMGDQPELETETNVFLSQEPCEEAARKDISTNQCTDQVTKETIFQNEAKCPPITDNSINDIAMLEFNSDMYKDSPDENVYGGTSEINKYDSRGANENVQNEQILKSKLSTYGADQPSDAQICFLGSSHPIEENQVKDSSGMDMKIDINIDDAKEDKQEAILNSELSPIMLYQLTLDDALPSKSPSTIGVENGYSKGIVDISATGTEKIDLETECNQRIPNSSEDKSAQSCLMEVNPLKSSNKILSVNKQTGVEFVKKSQISSGPNPRSSLISAPQISKPSSATAKSSSQSPYVPRVKKTAAKAVPKSPQFLKSKGPIPQSTTPSVKPAFLSPLKKGPDSLPSKKNSISADASRKPTPTSIHMSLNFGSKVSGSVVASEFVNEPRKSFFMEKMGDKDIVKRAFRAFQNMSLPLNSVSCDANATSKKMEKNKADVKPSTPILQKEKQRLIKKDVKEQSKKPLSIFKTKNLALYSKEDKKVKKVTEKIQHKEVEKNSYHTKHKEEVQTSAGARRQSLTCKANTQPGSDKGQRLSKSFQDKDASKSDDPEK